MQGHRGQDGEQHGVGRRGHRDLPHALDRHGDETAGGSRANPEHRRTIAPKAPRNLHGRSGGRQRCRHRENRAALGQQLKILVVRVVDVEGVRDRLVDRHGARVGADADADEREVAHDPPRQPPDLAPPAEADRHRLVDAVRQRAPVRVRRRNREQRQENCGEPPPSGCGNTAACKPHQTDQPHDPARQAGSRHRHEQHRLHQAHRRREP